MKAVIMCGGIGSKMWPQSRSKSPKHFLPLLNGKSLFQINYDTLRKGLKAEDIYLQTNAVQAEIALSQVPEIKRENIFVEPEIKNQGPATGMAAAMLYKLGFKDEPFMIVQADVLREPGEKFLDMLGAVDGLARKTNNYITGGFVPDRLIAGVDYLVKGATVLDENGVKVYEVADYIDRTEEDKIKQYLGTDRLLLHANHTAMTPDNLMKMFQKYKMEWYEPLMKMAKGSEVVSEYGRMPKGPIEDVTVKTYQNKEALVVELPFEWVDFGTWESIAKYLGTETDKDVIQIDSNNNFVRSPTGKTLALIGVENVVVVDTGDALLITKMDQTGKVGQVVDKLKEEGKTELL